MNTEILEKKYQTLKEDIDKYYNNIISKQEEPLIINEDLHYIVDYVDQNTGTYCEAFVRQLTTENILVWDRELGEIVCIELEQLNIQDKIQILEIYETETPQLCL
jgi:hypothetical protein